MGRMGMKVWTSDDKEHVGMQLEEDDRPLAHILFDGATTEKHIHDVARHRAQLKEEVTPDLDPGARLEAIVGPV